MKKILITGANSYIGTSFEKYMAQWPVDYRVDTISVHGDAWKNADFSQYDSVFHVAGIAHTDSGRVSEKHRALYYHVNTDLAVEAARKAKADGAKQFIFMSSAIVYGGGRAFGKARIITKDTPVAPTTIYGDSKAQAEIKIMHLQDDRFHVVILRAPMIYGPGSKGNYSALSRLAQRLPIFPYVENQRSMLFIDNLTEFVRLMVNNWEQGIFWPQNTVYSNTSELVRMIAAAHGKKITIIKGFGWTLKLLRHCTDLVDKAFGSLCYAKEMSEYSMDYCRYTLEQSVQITEASEE